MPYYSPTQVSIYIDDVWVDDVHDFSWNLVQQRHPVYGYRDQDYRRTARGKRLVQGQFSLNFRQAGFLKFALHQLKLQEREGLFRVDDREAFDFNLTTRQASEPANGNSSKTVAQSAMEKALFSVTGNSVPGQPNKYLEGLIGGLRDAFWSDQQSSMKIAADDRRGASPRLSDESSYTKSDVLPDTPIRVVARYGPVNEDANTAYYVFDKVELTAVGQQVTMSPPMDGEPIQEGYEFIARTVQAVRNVNNQPIREPRIA